MASVSVPSSQAMLQQRLQKRGSFQGILLTSAWYQ